MAQTCGSVISHLDASLLFQRLFLFHSWCTAGYPAFPWELPGSLSFSPMGLKKCLLKSGTEDRYMERQFTSGVTHIPVVVILSRH